MKLPLNRLLYYTISTCTKLLLHSPDMPRCLPRLFKCMRILRIYWQQKEIEEKWANVDQPTILSADTTPSRFPHLTQLYNHTTNSTIDYFNKILKLNIYV